MAANAKTNLTFTQGKTWELEFANLDSNGDVVQFPGTAVIRFAMRADPEDAVATLEGDSNGSSADVIISVDRVAGTFTWRVESTATAAVAAETYHYEFEQDLDGAGYKPPFLSGRIIVEREQVR